MEMALCVLLLLLLLLLLPLLLWQLVRLQDTVGSRSHHRRRCCRARWRANYGAVTATGCHDASLLSKHTERQVL
jgi:hypothetical protein